MPEAATGRFTDPAEYQASLPDVTVELVVTGVGAFDAQLTWAKLPNVRLVRAQEAANSFDNEGRKEGIRQFIDEKSYKPGTGTYDVSKKKRGA